MSGVPPWLARLRRRLERQEALGLKRDLREREGPPGRAFLLGGREVLSFATNDYLGLAADRRLAEAAGAAARRWGVGAAAARLLAGTVAVHRELEAALAEHLGADAAVALPAGYMANLAATSVLLAEGEPAYFDRANHASLRDGVEAAGGERRAFPHRDAGALAALVEAGRAGRGAILTESVFSMDGDLPDLERVAALSRGRDLPLLVDEAHALGVFGPDGRGAIAEAGVAGGGLVVTATLSKALGAQGGVVAGPREVVSAIVGRGRAFLFATGIAPPIAAAALEGLRISRAEPERRARLWRLADRLRGGLRALGFDLGASRGPIVPIPTGSVEATNAAADALLARGIHVPAIRPPTVPHGLGRLRISVTASHEEADVDRLLEACAALPRRGAAR